MPEKQNFEGVTLPVLFNIFVKIILTGNVYVGLTLFRPGGGGGGGGERVLLGAATLEVNNFVNIKANATKLGDVF